MGNRKWSHVFVPDDEDVQQQSRQPPHTHERKEGENKKWIFFGFLSAVWFRIESASMFCFVLFFGWKGETSCISVFSLEITSRVGLREQVVRPVCVWCVVVLLKKKKKTKENWVDEASAKAGARWLPAEFFKWPPILFFFPPPSPFLLIEWFSLSPPLLLLLL